MAELLAGTLVDHRYRIRREIARGGMCVVYCATHEVTGRSVAVKVLREESADDDGSRKRLIREAQALEMARGPQVVDLVDAAFLANGSPYLVMEMLEGRTLEGVLAARRRLSIAQTVALAIHVCRALWQAHSRSIVHRDIKPGNIVIVHSYHGVPVAKLIDFGIAVPILASGGPAGQSASKITRPGEFYGTPEYVSPEVVQEPGLIDRRSDIYALGITMYECLAGDVPFKGGFADVVLKVLMAGGAPDIREVRPETPEALAMVIRRALAPSPAGRFADCREMEQALQAVRSQLEMQGATGPETGGEQRRRYTRAPYVTPVRIQLPSQQVVLGRSEDISEGGLLVVADQSCPDATRVEVRFMMPFSGEITAVEANTRWVRNAREKVAVGLEFTALTEAVRHEIATFVQREFVAV